MQEFSLALPSLVYDCPLLLRYIERDLEAIYSNSNILFLHKHGEILFRAPDLHFMV